MYIKHIPEKTIEFIKTYPYFIRNDMQSFNDKMQTMSDVQSVSLLKLLGYDLDTHIVRGNE